MTDDAPDLLVRIRGRQATESWYPVEAELSDGSRYNGGRCQVPEEGLLEAYRDSPAYGQKLFESLFDEKILPAYNRAIAAAAASGSGLTVRLVIDPEASALEAIRWERLYRQRDGNWVAVSRAGDTPFSRYRRRPAIEPKPVATRPIQILLAVSDPKTPPPLEGVPPLRPIVIADEVRAFHAAVQKAARDDEVDVKVLALRHRLGADLADDLERDGFQLLDRPATLEEFVRHLTGAHVVHFIGHGSFNKEVNADGSRDSALLFEHEEGDEFDPVPTAALVERFAAAEVAPSLVYLSACSSGRSEPDGPHPFIGIGPRLIDAGVAAVIAMQDVIPVETSRTLTGDFYSALLTHGLVDRALNSAREIIFDEQDLNWTVPVLFTRLRRGRLFVPQELANRVIADDVALTPEPDHGVIADRLAVVPKPRRRPAPVLLLPRDFPNLIGREAEVRQALDALGSASFVEFHGSPGSGKTVLLRHVANRAQAGSPDGVIHLTNRETPLQDLFQFMFDALYEADASLRPTDADLVAYLAQGSGVISVDDADMPPDVVQQLIGVVRNGRFLLAAKEQNVWGEGVVRPLSGLAPDARLRLFARGLGRNLTDDETNAAVAICEALGGNPLHILQAAALAGQGQWQVLPSAAVAAPEPVVLPSQSAIDALEPPARDVLGLIAAADAPISLEHIEAIAEQADAGPPCDALLRAGLVKAASPRFVLAEPLAAAQLAGLQVPAWRARLRRYLSVWVEQNRRSPRVLVRDVDLILGLIKASAADGDTAATLRLSRGAEGALILAKRWRRWELLLEDELAVARDARDDAAAAWALHQTGSRALALQDEKTARTSLTEALRIRTSLGDLAGATATRHNLELLGPIPPPNGKTGRKLSRWRRLPWIIGGGLIAAAAIVFLLPHPVPHHPATNIEPKQLDLGQVQIGAGSSAIVTLTNAGDADLVVSEAVLDPALDDLVVTNGCSAPVRPQDACAITVAFAPLLAGNRGTNLVVTDNSVGGSQTVPIVAVGVPPPGEPALAIEPPALDFGVVRPRDAASLPLSLTNVGTADLQIAAVGPLVSPDYAVTVDGCTGMTLVPTAACNLVVEFRPSGPGDLLATLTIQDNTAGLAHQIDLSGSGYQGRPDLIVTFNDTVQPRFEDGRMRQQVWATLRNAGETDSPTFAVGAFYVDRTLGDLLARPIGLDVEQGPILAPTAEGIAITLSPMPVGVPFDFTGWVVFPAEAQGHSVFFGLYADPCFSGPFDPSEKATCAIEELDEANNASRLIPTDVPAVIR